jgi:predicted DCC family thiol-disulfide oxidoreductase YuxK
VPSTTLIYASDCGFCRSLLAKLLAWNWRGVLRPVALETEEADRLLAGMPKERQVAS